MRTTSLLLLFLLAGCTPKTKDFKDVLPVEVQRAWTLKRTRSVDVPAAIGLRGVVQSVEARYEGNGAIDVQLYEMKVEASAFELMQTWRQSEGVATYTGKYFVVAKPEGPDRATTTSFLQELRQALANGPK